MPRALSARRIVGGLARIGLAAGVVVAALTGYAAYRIWEQGGRDEVRHADAIVVLGAAQYDGRPSPVFEARLSHAVALWRAGWAPWLVVTGGKQEGDRVTEAETARDWAEAHGVPAGAILVEPSGRTTLESLRGVAALFRSRGLREAILVSDPTHMLRVLRIARDQGIRGYGSPTRTSPAEADPARRTEATIHELGALGIYFLTGRGEER